MTDQPFFNIDAFIALCDDDPELALRILDSHMTDSHIPELTPPIREYLDSHYYFDSFRFDD